MLSTDKIVVLIVNLGSPNQLTLREIRSFLAKFLSDKRVVELPKMFWYPILYGIILPFRARKLLKQYRQIWLDNFSPLIHYSKLQATKLRQKLNKQEIIVEYALCYAKPLVTNLLRKLHNQYNIVKLIVIPLYPQYSASTTLAVFDQVTRFYQDKYYLPNFSFIHSFYNNEIYIKAIADKIRDSWQKNGRGQKLIFSYHSLPEARIKAGDVYLDECVKTTKLIATELNLNSNNYIVAFQSKFGKQKWLSPSTVDVLTNLARNNIQAVDIICPGFVSDCLETLEEIAMTNKDIFIKNGGIKYTYISCLNDDDSFINVLADLVD